MKDKRAKVFVAESSIRLLVVMRKSSTLRLKRHLYGVPYRPYIWGAGWDIQTFGFQHCYFLSTSPWDFSEGSCLESQLYPRLSSWINQVSVCSGVWCSVHDGRLRFVTVLIGLTFPAAYFRNSVDTVLISPLLTFHSCGQQTEYVLGGVLHYMYIRFGCSAVPWKESSK